MSFAPQHMKGITTHARRGEIKHSFTYSVDFVLLDAEQGSKEPAFFSRNKHNLASVRDSDYGGKTDGLTGADWARNVLADHGYRPGPQTRLMLLTQPRLLGRVFNPVSFWLQLEGDALCAVIAEVNNTFGDRHAYLCRRAGFAPIDPSHALTTDKIFHVSPFQQIGGTYQFNFRVTADKISIRIVHKNGDDGVIATLSGNLKPLTNSGVLGMLLRLPAAPIRVIFLIHWHALRLKLKGAIYRSRPQPPLEEIS